MAWPNPASDLAALVASTGPHNSVAFVVDTNVFTGPEKVVRSEVPELAVFCLNIGGLPPEPYLGTGRDFIPFQVEVTVRSPSGDFSTGEAIARSLIRALHQNKPSGYVATFAQQSGPEYLGSDEKRLHAWRLVIEMWWTGS